MKSMENQEMEIRFDDFFMCYKSEECNGANSLTDISGK